MKRYKFGFRNLSGEKQIQKCEQMVAAVGALPPERRDGDYLAEAQALVTETRAIRDEIEEMRAGLRAKISQYKQLLPRMRNATMRTATNVGLLCQFDPVTMMEIGLEFEAPKNVRVGPPGSVGNVRAEATAMEGEVVLGWKRPLRECFFEVEFCLEPLSAEKWNYCATALRQTCRVKGSQPGVKYWFRVRASNANGKGPWSNPVAVRVR